MYLLVIRFLNRTGNMLWTNRYFRSAELIELQTPHLETGGESASKV
jgi:hypothetical protein